jgi:type IX secretion system PorP/SprF family membrane protein
MNDKSLNGGLQTSSVGLSAAYHVGLDEDGNNTIGLGFQGTYHQRRSDYSKLSFGEQFGSGGYDPSLPVGESFRNANGSFFDANAGVVFNAYGEDKSFFGGVSVYNILKHNEAELADAFKMPARVVVQAGTQVYIGDYGKVYGSLTHMSQGGANETTFGGAYGLQLGERNLKNEINVGMWYRLKDAVIPYVGYHYEGFHIGLSYDHTVSGLKTGAQVRNGYELTLSYTAIDKRQLKILVPWY